MGPNSETESEPSVEVCEADRVAYCANGATRVLRPKGRRDSARQEPVKMLIEDAAISGVDLAPEVDGFRTFRACTFRAQAREAQAAARKFARARCYRAKTTEKDGPYVRGACC